MRQDSPSVGVVVLCLMQNKRNGSLQMDICFVQMVVGLGCVLMVDAHVVVAVLLRKHKGVTSKLVGCIAMVMGAGRSCVLIVVGHVAQRVLAMV